MEPTTRAAFQASTADDSELDVNPNDLKKLLAQVQEDLGYDFNLQTSGTVPIADFKEASRIDKPLKLVSGAVLRHIRLRQNLESVSVSSSAFVEGVASCQSLMNVIELGSRRVRPSEDSESESNARHQRALAAAISHLSLGPSSPSGPVKVSDVIFGPPPARLNKVGSYSRLNPPITLSLPTLTHHL